MSSIDFNFQTVMLDGLSPPNGSCSVGWKSSCTINQERTIVAQWLKLEYLALKHPQTLSLFNFVAPLLLSWIWISLRPHDLLASRNDVSFPSDEVCVNIDRTSRASWYYVRLLYWIIITHWLNKFETNIGQWESKLHQAPPKSFIRD